jgi:hypothetical protein
MDNECPQGPHHHPQAVRLCRRHLRRCIHRHPAVDPRAGTGREDAGAGMVIVGFGLRGDGDGDGGSKCPAALFRPRSDLSSPEPPSPPRPAVRAGQHRDQMPPLLGPRLGRHATVADHHRQPGDVGARVSNLRYSLASARHSAMVWPPRTGLPMPWLPLGRTCGVALAASGGSAAAQMLLQWRAGGPVCVSKSKGTLSGTMPQRLLC